MYNPWSIMNCLHCAKKNPKEAIKEYWIANGNMIILENVFLKLEDDTLL